MSFIERDLNRIVPAQIIMLIEDGADLFLQVLWDLDFRALLLELLLYLLEFLAQLMTVMECSVGLREKIIVRDHLFEAVVLQLALYHFNQSVAGHGVQLNALIEQDIDLRVRGTILGELSAQDVSTCPGRRGGLLLKAFDVGKPQPEINHLESA